ncbi:hypothetical protein SAMN05216480_106146 [Pustulibacterium marinum]|uniref:Uncharacterized protein n=1 Tax=Pustulibacterium marinum TaxID=1224947 RepID=A0A1I7H057_9FLAO|nr:hypothetical protein [Pustulibacterium marinum]SFU54063.1 hypothetical protein SAMN05216480_106146 [Pustulibacterium marinum]
MWFEQLTGFKEESPENVRNNLEIKGDKIVSLINSRSFSFGKLDILTLAKLKKLNNHIEDYHGKIKVTEVVANVQELHCQKENSNALFQAASQFNLLEMVSPAITPEQGIDRYEFDYTQGPACAISCGAGTIYRNYFVEVNGQTGQSIDNQIDCLDLIGKELNNDKLNLWEMQNGYALVNQNGLLAINKIIAQLTEIERERLKEKLKTGIQWNTEVTKSTEKQKVSQIYCAALPVAYSHLESFYWEYFARVILEATYESTLLAGVLNMENNNSNKVFLTLVGGGAFGNEEYWILESMQKAIRKFKNVPLDIRIVSYGNSNTNLIKCINEI